MCFGVVPTHGTIWKERGLLTQKENIQHDVNLPKSSMAVTHCKGHQKSDTVQETGN